jgi:hypothetical protein
MKNLTTVMTSLTSEDRHPAQIQESQGLGRRQARGLGSLAHQGLGSRRQLDTREGLGARTMDRHQVGGCLQCVVVGCFVGAFRN